MTTIRIFRSTALLLILFLAAANLFFTRLDASSLIPMAQMNPQEAAQRALSFKMHALEAGPDPDVLLIGSSLPMAAAYYADAKHHKNTLDTFIAQSELDKINPFQAYPRADRLSQVLTERGKEPVRVVNLTAPACMISDGFLVLAEAIQRKNVKTVIWGIAPRDFVDNVIPSIGKTPAFFALSESRHLPNIIATETKSAPANAELVMESSLSFYKQRGILHHAFDLWMSSVFKQPISLTDAGLSKRQVAQGVPHDDGPAQSRPASPKTSTALVKQDRNGAFSVPAVSPAKFKSQLQQVQALPAGAQKESLHALALDPSAMEPGWNQSLVAQYVDYFHRYNPPNYNRLSVQVDQLDRALTLCKSKGIGVILVQMPLPLRHQALIDKKLFADYKAAVAQVASRGGATLLNLNTPDAYGKEDWIDSLHVTAGGADKFLDALGQALGKQNRSSCGRPQQGM